MLRSISFLTSFVFLTTCATSHKLPEATSKPAVILKLDDLWNEDGLVHPGWIQVMDFLNQEDIVGTIGLVANSLETTDTAYFAWINARQKEGHEIWHHGWCHCKPVFADVAQPEFRGTPATYQLDNLAKAQHLAQEKLGLTLHTFGAPYNSTDATTATALAQLPDIKVWLYKETAAPTDKFLLPRISAVNIEYPVHQPDFAQFKAGYDQFKSEPVLVIQGHPRSWVADASRFQEFQKIVLFLKAAGVVFTTPYAYYQRQGE
ncbi:MAG: hypothetical protein DA408_09240 [Bacteroidetes bacterium]|nr:MAG: hypothetical protein DA408_09240 [Bacteroidota bacterium]